MQNFDVIVVGAGIVGSCTSLFLSQQGASVLLLEKRRDIGLEASGVNAGTLSAQVKNLRLLDLTLKSLALWGRLEDLLGVELAYRRGGGLNVATDAGEMKRLRLKAEAQNRGGLKVKLLTKKGLGPYSAFLSDKVTLAGYSSLDGCCDPRTVIKGLKISLLSRKISLHTGEEALALEEIPGGLVRVRTDKDSYFAGKAVVAAGLWTNTISVGNAAKYAAAFPLRIRVQQVITTERLEPFLPVVVTDISGRVSLKQLPDEKLVIGGAWPGITDSSYRVREVIPSSLAGNCIRACECLKNITNINLIRAWCGIDSETPDLLPVLDHPPSSDRILYVKPGVAGFTFGPYLARLAADLAAGKRGPEDPEIADFKLERFMDSNKEGNHDQE